MNFTVIHPEQVGPLKRRNTLRLAMGPPVLVIEIVSPVEVQRNRDYVAKRGQYQDLGIPEYWIVDPQTATVLVLALRDGSYEEYLTLSGGDRLQSFQLGALTITAAELFPPADTEN